MSKTIKVKTKIPVSGGNVENEFDIRITDESTTQDVVMVYVSQADGGPLMRPKNPPA